jgi:hypothetical protein
VLYVIFLAAWVQTAPVTHSQENPDPAQAVVFSLNELKLYGPAVELKQGTGFCLDPGCRFVGTNYHVAIQMGSLRKIKGEQVVQRQLATGPDDEGAIDVEGTNGPAKYNPARDLAIFELSRPLSLKGKYHGVAFSLDDLPWGREVSIYAYPKVGIGPMRRITRFHGEYTGQTTTGNLAFRYELSAPGTPIAPGSSGGIVVDNKTGKVVGILCGVDRHGDRIAMAVRTQALADFLSQVQPFLHSELFPDDTGAPVSPLSADVYPPYEPSAGVPGILRRRPEEPLEVRQLRQKAQMLADNMRNFIALQTFAWGKGAGPPVAQAQYEVRVIDGYQRVRDYPSGKKNLENVPFPPMDTAIRPGDEWSSLLELVGSNLGLRVRRTDDAIVNGRRVRVFQYYAALEDGACAWSDVFDFVVFSFEKTHVRACRGEVWTDDDLNILRMSENLIQGGAWKNPRLVLTYGWIKKPTAGIALVPVTIDMEVEHKNKIYWCRGQFTDYQMFFARSRIREISLSVP